MVENLALKERYNIMPHDLCRTFGAILKTLGLHPMLLYVAPLVLS